MQPHLRSTAIVALALALALFAGAVVAQATAEEWRSARPSVVVDLEPGTDSGVYDVQATVTDLRSHRVLAQQRLQVQAGSMGTVVAGTEGSVTMRLEVGVDATATRATWSFELRDGGELLSEQRVTLTLARPRDASY